MSFHVPPGSAIVQPRTPPPELTSAWFSNTGPQVRVEIQSHSLADKTFLWRSAVPASAPFPLLSYCATSGSVAVLLDHCCREEQRIGSRSMSGCRNRHVHVGYLTSRPCEYSFAAATQRRNNSASPPFWGDLCSQIAVWFEGSASSQEINGSYASVSCEEIFSPTSSATLGTGCSGRFTSSSTLTVSQRGDNVEQDIDWGYWLF